MAPASARAAPADGSEAVDFAALLGGATDDGATSAAANTASATATPAPAAADDSKTETPASDDPAAFDWLAAIRQAAQLTTPAATEGDAQPTAANDDGPDDASTAAEAVAVPADDAARLAATLTPLPALAVTPATPATPAADTNGGPSPPAMPRTLARAGAASRPVVSAQETSAQTADTAADVRADERHFTDALADAVVRSDLPSLPAATPDPAIAAPAADTAAPRSDLGVGLPHAALPESTPARAQAPLPSALPMTLPPDHPEFTEALGERIVWAADAGLDSARIELAPAELGSMSVQVQLRGSEAQVAFTADNPATRLMLQQAMPQLRELFAGQGLQLLRTQIEQRAGGGSGGARGESGSGGSADGSGSSGERRGGGAVRRVSRLRLVDAYV